MSAHASPARRSPSQQQQLATPTTLKPTTTPSKPSPLLSHTSAGHSPSAVPAPPSPTSALLSKISAQAKAKAARVSRLTATLSGGSDLGGRGAASGGAKGKNKAMDEDEAGSGAGGSSKRRRVAAALLSDSEDEALPSLAAQKPSSSKTCVPPFPPISLPPAARSLTSRPRSLARSQ